MPRNRAIEECTRLQTEFKTKCRLRMNMAEDSDEQQWLSRNKIQKKIHFTVDSTVNFPPSFSCEVTRSYSHKLNRTTRFYICNV